MPELPEVEIVRQSLNKKIKGKIIQKVIVKNRNLRFKVPIGFEDFLENQKVIKVKRFSKYLNLFLSNNCICIIHLGMSGTIHLIQNKKKNKITNVSFYHSPILPSKHNHIEIFFENLKLVYNDPRRFGFFEIIENLKLLNKRFDKLGPEPFSSKFNSNYISSFLGVYQFKRNKISHSLANWWRWTISKRNGLCGLKQMSTIKRCTNYYSKV